MNIRDTYTIRTIFHAASVDLAGRSGPSACDSVLAIRQLYGDYTETIRNAWICMGFPDTRSIRLLIYIYMYIYAYYIS